jgi:ubiquitin carboxyl-terminal hydrolase 5/13
MISNKEKNGDFDPTKTFNFFLEQRLQCATCKCVRYAYHDAIGLSLPVPAKKEGDDYASVSIYECLEKFTATEDVEMTCPTCSGSSKFEK